MGRVQRLYIYIYLCFLADAPFTQLADAAAQCWFISLWKGKFHIRTVFCVWSCCGNAANTERSCWKKYLRAPHAGFGLNAAVQQMHMCRKIGFAWIAPELHSLKEFFWRCTYWRLSQNMRDRMDQGVSFFFFLALVSPLFFSWPHFFIIILSVSYLSLMSLSSLSVLSSLSASLLDSFTTWWKMHILANSQGYYNAAVMFLIMMTIHVYETAL